MDVKCGKGDQVILKDIYSQTFIGVVKSINEDLGRIVLKDMVQLPEHKPITGYRNFDRNEVLKIMKCEDSEEPFQDIKMQEAETPACEVPESVCGGQNNVQNEYKYIRDLGTSFHAAMSLLKTCTKIGIYGKDPSKGRLERLSLLAVSTPSNIFVFDLLALGDEVLGSGLKEILESPNIIKVVYDCRLLSDCLTHKHLIHLENVRDVEAEDIVVVFQDRRLIRGCARPLEYLCKVYLGLEVESCKEKTEVWRQRPLPNNLLEVLVSHVSTLIPLQEEIQRKYLEKLINASNIYNNHVRNADYFDFLHNEHDTKKTLRRQIGKLLAPQKKTRLDLMLRKTSSTSSDLYSRRVLKAVTEDCPTSINLPGEDVD